MSNAPRNELSLTQRSQIAVEHGPAEFEVFQRSVIGFAEQFNKDNPGGERFDLSEAAGEESGVIHFGDSSFEFGFDPGQSDEPAADIIYRFRKRPNTQPVDPDRTHSGGNGNGNGNGNGATLKPGSPASAPTRKDATVPLPSDPRNTPMMRYTPDILGSGTQAGQFAFYWDGETTDELAESLFREFIEWMTY